MELKIAIGKENSVYKDCVSVRERVFVEEQGFDGKLEFDGTDAYAAHIVAYDGVTPVGCCRYYQQDGDYYIGRVAVIGEYRGKNVGSLLIGCAEDAVKSEGGGRILVSAQNAAMPFYEKCGYKPCGGEHIDLVPHTMMCKDVKDDSSDVLFGMVE